MLQGFSGPEDGALSIVGLATDRGTLEDNANGTWTFTPEADDNGAIILGYSIGDSQGGHVAAQQSFVLAAVNDAPALKPAAFAVDENSAQGVDGDALAQGAAEQAQALQAARSTFLCLDSWMEQCGSLRPVAS